MAGRAKCETPSTLLEACSLTWTECWKCIWLPQMPATPMVVSFSTSLPTLKIPTLCWLGCGHHHFCCWQGTQVVGNGCTRPSSSIHRLRMGQPSASPTAPFTHLQKEQQESLLVADISLVCEKPTALRTLLGTAWRFQLRFSGRCHGPTSRKPPGLC